MHLIEKNPNPFIFSLAHIRYTKQDPSVCGPLLQLQLTSSPCCGPLLQLQLPQGILCCLNFTQSCLMRLEEKSIHVGQFHLVIVKEQ